MNQENQHDAGVPSMLSLEHFVMSRAQPAAEAGKSQLLIQLGHSVLLRLNAMPFGQLRSAELLRACEQSDEFPKDHLLLMQKAVRRGFEIRSTVSKARWADPLELAPVVDSWVLCWKSPAADQTPNALGLKAAAHYARLSIPDETPVAASVEPAPSLAAEAAPVPEAPAQPVKAKRTSDRLIALMQYAKSGEGDFSWRAVSSVLADLYHSSMSLSDAMHHLVSAYEEALDEPRFELSRGQSPMLGLILAPVKGHTSVEPMGPRDTSVAYRIEDIYDSMAARIFGQLSIARVDWLSPWKKEARAHVEH